jgi:phosphoglycolate phosphatase
MMHHAINRYDLAIFDFDGTLADSAGWFRSVVNHVALRYGFRQVTDEVLEDLRGQSSAAIIRYLGVPAWKMPFIAAYMRQLVARDAHQIALFDGIDALLSSLVECGVTIAIVTSNAEANVRRILGEQNSRRIDHYACGASLFGKAAKFRSVIKITKVHPDRTIAIGDEVRDLEAARKAGVSAGAVGWGYATVDRLRAEQPDYLFFSTDEIRQAVTRPSPAL